MVQACPSESTRQHCKCGHPPDTRGIEKESPTLNNFWWTVEVEIKYIHETYGKIQKWAQDRIKWKDFMATLYVPRG